MKAVAVSGGLVLVIAVIIGIAAWLAPQETAVAPTDLNEGNTMQTLTVTSEAFEQNGTIPQKYTCDGENISPMLSIGDVPAEAQSLVLVMDDPDIPAEITAQRGIEVFDHWVVFNISPDVTRVEEGSEPAGVAGVNSAGNTGYTGPCPPSQYEPTEHRYIFTVYALDTELALSAGASKQEVLDAMDGHVLAQGELLGKYERSQ